MKYRNLIGILGAIALLANAVVPSAQAITFTPPTDHTAPSQSTGGASRGKTYFAPSSTNTAPTQATGGASRGLFTPASGNTTPQQTTGGASRGNLFAPPINRRVPRQATGGASRGSLFTPSQGNGVPQQAVGGASRGNLFAPTKGSGAPQQATGGASRVGSYGLDDANLVGAVESSALTALLPQNFYGTTLAEYPTILVYLPATTATEAVFSLKDEAGNTLHQMTLSVTDITGIMAIKVPASAPALVVGKNYQWFLALKVDGRLTPSTPYVDGWMQRIAANADLVNALKQPDVLTQAKALGRNGVWYDCAATLATLHTNLRNENSLTKDWTELLDSVGLKEIAQVPILIAPY